MRDAPGWSLSLGRWGGVGVRLHILFLLFAVFAIAACLRSPDKDLLSYGITALLILFVSVVLHEAAHCAVAISAAPCIDRVVLWPLGGLEYIHPTHDVRHEFWMGMSGPLTNLAVSGLLAPALFLTRQSPFTLLNPLLPPAGVEGLSLANCVAVAFWINWVLATVNLLPAYPLDGGRILRALLSIQFDQRTSVTIVARVAQCCAVLICVLGVLLYRIYPFAWVPLVVFGIFLFFSAKQEVGRFERESMDESTLGYDFSQGYTSLDKTFDPVVPRNPGLVRSWIDQRREARQQRKESLERQEEQQVDDILSRMYECGIDCLSKAERSLLDRVSQRYRDRQRQ